MESQLAEYDVWKGGGFLSGCNMIIPKDITVKCRRDTKTNEIVWEYLM